MTPNPWCTTPVLFNIKQADLVQLQRNVFVQVCCTLPCLLLGIITGHLSVPGKQLIKEEMCLTHRVYYFSSWHYHMKGFTAHKLDVLELPHSAATVFKCRWEVFIRDSYQLTFNLDRCGSLAGRLELTGWNIRQHINKFHMKQVTQVSTELCPKLRYIYSKCLLEVGEVRLQKSQTRTYMFIFFACSSEEWTLWNIQAAATVGLFDSKSGALQISMFFIASMDSLI